MADQAPSSSLARYRPVVLSLTAFAAAYGLYLVYTQINPAASSPSTRIHRRNAIRQPRRRSQRLADSSDPADPDEPESTANQTDTALPVTPAAQTGTGQPSDTPNFEEWASYGLWQIENGDGQTVEIELLPRNLPTVQSLQEEHRMLPEQARTTVEAIYQQFLARFVVVHFQRDAAHLMATNWLGSWLAAAQHLASLGIPRDHVLRGLETFQRNLETQLANQRAVAEDISTVSGTEVGEFGPGRVGPGNNLKQLLYHIAEAQAHYDGHVHRGFRCDSCGCSPIRGTRWKCANCIDVDFCNDCHGTSMHNSNHIFYEIRIPTYSMSNFWPVQELSYPGVVENLTTAAGCPAQLLKELAEKVPFEKAEIEGLYDQFACMVDEVLPPKADGIIGGCAVSRFNFQKALMPVTRRSPLRPNIIFDRLFHLFDTDKDGMIDFPEFVHGVAFVRNKKKGKLRRRKTFEAYDFDGDGNVSRRDFLRMFRAYFAYNKDIAMDLMSKNESVNYLRQANQLARSSQTLSSAFTEDRIPRGDGRPPSKQPDEFGDVRHQPGQNVVRDDGDEHVDREAIAGLAWESQAQFPFDYNTGEPLSISDFMYLIPQGPNATREQEVKFRFDGKTISQARREAWRERWRRRRFLTDEEEGARGPDVRGGPFLRDDEMQTESGDEEGDDEVKAEVSEIAGYEIPKFEQDLGREVLFQVVESAFNELLDPLFQPIEKLHMEALEERGQLAKWKEEIDAFSVKREQEQKERERANQDPLIATAAGAADEASRGGVERIRSPALNGHPPEERNSENTQLESLPTVEDVASHIQPLVVEEMPGVIADVEATVSTQPLHQLLEANGYTAVDPDSIFHAFLNPPLSAGQQPALTVRDDSEPVPYEDGSRPDSAAVVRVDVLTHPVSTDEPSNGGANIVRRAILHIPAHNLELDFGLPGEGRAPNFDPTLPQFRPNSVAESFPDLPEPPSVTLDPVESMRVPPPRRNAADDAESRRLRPQFEAMFLGWQRDSDGIVKNGPAQAAAKKKDKVKSETGQMMAGADPHVEDRDGKETAAKPDDVTLERYLRLREALDVIADRGGPGRLTWSEYDRFMSEVRGHDFVFFEGWLEFCNF